MSELFLIAHRVRGEATFDIAQRMTCPECDDVGCVECDTLGYWWIIGTSGHRAYPWQFTSLHELRDRDGYLADDFNEMPEGWPDHYRHGPAPKINIKALFKAEPKQHIVRRL